MIMSDDDRPHHGIRTIKLKTLKPNEYRLWAIQAEASFEVYNCLNLVLGIEQKPSDEALSQEDEAVDLSALHLTRKSWITRHALAREALLQALGPTDLAKILSVKDDASAIWNRLKEEYGKSLDFEYIRVNSEFQSLRKDSKTSMDEHINRFNLLLQAVNYNKPPEIPENKTAAVNLYFLQSLGTDWEVWGMAKGDALRSTPTAELMAEVRALAMRGKSSLSTLSPTSTTLPTAQDASINSAYLNKATHSAGQSGKWYKNKQDHKSTRSQPYDARHRNKRRTSHDPNKYCPLHQCVGHNIFECRKAKREKFTNDGDGKHGGNGNGNRSAKQDRSESYQPNFKYPSSSYFPIINVTRLIHVNSTEISDFSKIHNSDWLIDSAANAYCTPHMSDLRSFIATEVGKVKGFGGTLTTAVGKGTITLTDSHGKRLTLHNVCYCPGSQDRIISLMKFRREHHVDFQFTGLETFMLQAANGFEVHGRAINDILHISLDNQPEINVVMTRNTAKTNVIANLEATPSAQDESDVESDPESRMDVDSDSIITTRCHQETTMPLTCTPQQLWHLRFGHASSTSLRKLSLVKSLFDSRKCTSCLRAKKTRKPFPRSESRAGTKLERVHSDICGPFPESKDGTNYNLLFIDEATGLTYSFDIKDRSSATVKEKFVEYMTEVERQSGMKIKKLHVDGGGEYKGDLTPILKTLGIKYEPTPPRTPECNGKAERMNRTLNNMARAMLTHSNMPHSFWPYAIKMATYLRNRLPSSALNHEIPYERWFEKPLQRQDLKILKPFGCIVWDQIPQQDRKRQRLNKLADQGTRGCFVGYVSSSTYLYWNFQRQEVVHSHDLTFHEMEFPQRSDFKESDDAFKPFPILWPPTTSRDDDDSNDDYDEDESSEEQDPPMALSTPQARIIHDEIIVQRPPHTVFSMEFGPLADSTPKSLTDAMNRPDSKLWWEALCAEIKAVINNNTWTLIELPPGKRAIPLKWVFKVKRDAKGNFEKYKARIVVKGYSQVAGLDFNETFAPVVRVESVRILFAIAAANDLYILHIDCKNAFLHGQSDVEIYVFQPEGFVDPRFPKRVLRLNKSLYGLKQASRIWYLFLCGIIIELGFVALETDSCIYVRGNILIAVYVDDIQVAAKTKEQCESFFHELAQRVNIDNKGPVKSFLGINVIRDWDSHLIAINQAAFIDHLLADFGLTDANSAGSPLDPSLPLLKAKPRDVMCNAEYYQHVTGSLNHLAVYTRPDIAFAVSKLAQFNSNPTMTHLKAAMHVARYLKGTRNLCIVYKRQPSIINIVGYSDADWGSDENDRISYTGYMFMVHGGPASWTSHKQTTVANSTMESEYMALSDASREAVARGQFFQELNIPSLPIVILSDNVAALDLADGTTTNHRKSKHIDIRYHQVRHFIQEGKVEVAHIASEYQIADIFTKALGPQRHQRLIKLMGMCNSHDLQ
jgi:hypothetical protein